MQHLALGLVEIHDVHMGNTHACQGPSAWHPHLKHINSITQPGAIHKLEGALYPAVDVIDEGNEQTLIGHFHLHIEPLANSVNVAIQLAHYPYKAYLPTIKRQKYFLEQCQIPHRCPGR